MELEADADACSGVFVESALQVRHRLGIVCIEDRTNNSSDCACPMAAVSSCSWYSISFMAGSIVGADVALAAHRALEAVHAHAQQKLSSIAAGKPVLDVLLGALAGAGLLLDAAVRPVLDGGRPLLWLQAGGAENGRSSRPYARGCMI